MLGTHIPNSGEDMINTLAGEPDVKVSGDDDAPGNERADKLAKRGATGRNS